MELEEEEEEQEQLEEQELKLEQVLAWCWCLARCCAPLPGTTEGGGGWVPYTERDQEISSFEGVISSTIYSMYVISLSFMSS